MIRLSAGQVVTREFGLPSNKGALQCVLRVLQKDIGLRVDAINGSIVGGELPATLYAAQGIFTTTLAATGGTSKVIVTIDNSYSRLTGKTVLFGAVVVTPTM